MRIAHFVTAAVFAVSAAASQAEVINWGDHGTTPRVTTGSVLGDFSNTYTFTLSHAGSLGGTVVSNNLTIGGLNFLRITNGAFALFKDNGNTPATLVKSFSFDGTTGDTTRLFDHLTTGKYFYTISGKADGAVGGLYTFTSAVTAAVPEPETYALMGLGLAGLLLAKRKRKTA